MIYLKKYKELFESIDKNQDYNIFDFRSDLIKNSTMDDKHRRNYVDYFIGDGYYEKVIELVDNIYKTLEKIDLESIEDRLYYIFDLFPDSKPSVSTVIAYGDWYNVGKKSEDFFTGSFHRILISNKEFITNRIIIDIITPITSLIIHNEESQMDLSGFANLNIKELINNMSSYERSKYDNFSIDNFFESYKPSIYIRLAGGYIDIEKVETLFDENIPSVLSELEEIFGDQYVYDIIYPYCKGTREYKAGSTSEYILKIILK